MNKIYESLISKRGLTLIEILLVVIILGIVIAIATTMIIQTFGIVGSSSSRMSTKQLTALAEERIEKHLRTAIDSEDNDFGEERSQWFFKGYSNDGEEIDYQINFNNNKLFLKVSDQTQKVILRNVNDFYIEEVNNNGVFKLYFEINDDSNIIESERFVTARNY